MTALPTTSDFNASTNTEGQLKAAFTNLLAYLAGVLGSTGTPASAIAALGTAFATYSARTAATTVTVAQRGVLVDCSGTWALTLPSSSGLDVGWGFFVRNFASGLITLTPPDSATIDALTTLPLVSGRFAFVFWSGSGWVTDQIIDKHSIKQPARGIALTNINLTTGGLLTIDGLTTLEGLRILVAGQTTASENGIYLASSGAWKRAPDADESSELGGATVIVDGGTTYGGTLWQSDWKRGQTVGSAACNWYRIFDTRQVLAGANGGTGQPSLPLGLGALTGYATTATAAGTTTLTAASMHRQVFTGTAVQNVVLPTASAVVPGFGFSITNQSTGALSIKASDASAVATVQAGQTVRVICNAASGATNAAWTVEAMLGVIETGSNANGKWTRYADGTLECFTTLAASSSAAVTWTYPAAFIAAPVVNGTAQAVVLSAVCLDAAPTTTTATFSARDKTDARRADTCHLKAVGRWF